MLITEELDEARRVNLERDSVYKDGYKTQAAVLAALFPNGIEPQTPEEWERFTFLFMIVAKLCRYTICLNARELHADSILDMGVYAFMTLHHDKGNPLKK